LVSNGIIFTRKTQYLIKFFCAQLLGADSLGAATTTDHDDGSSETDDKTTDLPPPGSSSNFAGRLAAAASGEQQHWTQTISMSADSGYGGDSMGAIAGSVDKLGVNVGRSQSMKSHQVNKK